MATGKWSTSLLWCYTTTNVPCLRPWNWRWPKACQKKARVLNLLHRLIDGKVVGGPPLDMQQALALHREPKANVERYVELRGQIGGGGHAS